MSKLDDLFTEVFDAESDSLGDEMPFAQWVGWDSLKHVQLVVGVESRFGIELAADEIARMTTKRSAREVLAARGVDV